MKFCFPKKLISFTIVLAFLCSLSGCGDDPSEATIYSDRVYVSDHLFVSDEETDTVLPDNYIYVGTVETLLSKSEPAETNNASNCLAVGSTLYLPSNIDLEDVTSTIKLYAKNGLDDEYVIFSLMFAVG